MNRKENKMVKLIGKIVKKMLYALITIIVIGILMSVFRGARD